MVKFDFSIQTRDGPKVDRIFIMGEDRPAAERKLRQMYRQCTILHCEVKLDGDKQRPASSMEDILSLISKEH
jgi:hypothetical protein